MSQSTQQWKGKTGGGNFGQKFLFFALSRMKPTVLYPLMTLTIPFYLLFSPSGSKAINRYFRNIHHYSKWKAFWKTAENFYIFGQVVLDRFAIFAGNTKYFKVSFTGKEYVDKLFDSDKAFIMAGAHIGNMELLGHSLKQNNKTIYCLGHEGESQGIQQQRNKAFSERRSVLISHKNDMSHLFTIKAAFDNKDVLTILCDRYYENERSTEVNFCGQPATFSLSAFLLAAKTEVEMVSVFVMKEKRLKYHVHIVPISISEDLPPAKKANALAQKYVSALEEIVKKYPTQWFNYYNFWNNTTQA